MIQAPSDGVLARMMALHPKIIDLTLDRVWRLLAALGHPERTLPPVVHIAGTNGKGSTQAMMRAGLEAWGDRVHAYTSPHLVRFHERIRLAGELISEEHLTEILNECEAANGGEGITYFEITTVAALLAFARTPAEWTLLEVGLGGRLDATNVVEAPAITAITPVSLDHQQFLGDTVAEIAGEKAGILKRGVPCVVAPQSDEAMEVIERTAARVGSPLIAHGQHWHVWEERGRLVFQDETGLLDLPLPNLPGPFQFQNAGTAIAALRALGRDEAACTAAAVTQAYWPARMQRLTKGPLAEAAGPAELWLDGGHNPSAGAAMAQTLSSMSQRPTYLVMGMLGTKDASGYLDPLAAHTDGVIAVTIPDEAAAMPAAEIAQSAEDIGIPSEVADDPLEAVRAIARDTPHARIVVCGSLYLAGKVLRDNG
ncbi:MAG: folylpolyglutamate synthase/dihydrofolate synthase family protein [Pseudomonadota bacterium]